VPRFPARLTALALGVVVALAAGEAALRVSGRYATYSERNYGTYRQVYDRELPTWIHAWEPDATFEFKTAEFGFTYQTNADGVRDLPHEVHGEPGRRRIVVLGDSFTEGVGAERHEAWPAVLATILEAQGQRVEVFNAGMSGSDPFFEYQLLRQRFLRYAPDLVIVSINESDHEDALLWGGMERFCADGRTRGRRSPLSMHAYRYSHLARWILHEYAGLSEQTLAFGPRGRQSWDAQHTLLEAFAAMHALRAEVPFELVVLTHPLPHGVVWKQSGYFQIFHDRLAELGVASVDLADALHAELDGLEVRDYSWPIDMHYNARGYAAFARAVARLLNEDEHLAARWR